MNKQFRGYYYSFSREKLEWWLSVPAREKLEWLEEANQFLQKAMTVESKEILQAFRRGRFEVEGDNESDTEKT